MKHLLSIAALLCLAGSIRSQTSNTPKKAKELVLLAGTIQPFLLKGGNIELDFYLPKTVFNYSHGFSLEMESASGTTVGEAKRQSVAYHIPYSTGFGIGYRLTKYVDVRFESKLHRFEAYYDGSDRKATENRISSYTTATLGIGAYFRWKPFEKQHNVLKGIFTSTSLRYWQNVWTSLNNAKTVYANTVTGKTESLKASNIGIANTPFLFNIALGYSIVF